MLEVENTNIGTAYDITLQNLIGREGTGSLSKKVTSNDHKQILSRVAGLASQVLLQNQRVFFAPKLRFCFSLIPYLV